MLPNCCFNWKVWAGAGAVVLGVLVVVPAAFGAVLPLTIGLACPLSMAAMMWGMRSKPGQGARGATALGQDERAGRIAALEFEIAALRDRWGRAETWTQPDSRASNPAVGEPSTAA